MMTKSNVTMLRPSGRPGVGAKPNSPDARIGALARKFRDIRERDDVLTAELEQVDTAEFAEKGQQTAEGLAPSAPPSWEERELAIRAAMTDAERAREAALVERFRSIVAEQTAIRRQAENRLPTPMVPRRDVAAERRLRALERKQDVIIAQKRALDDREYKVLQRLAAVPATTFEGLALKLAVIKQAAYLDDDPKSAENRKNDPAAMLLYSAARDAERLTGGDPNASGGADAGRKATG